MPATLKRRAPLVVALLALAGLLAACQKPAPKITVFGDGKSVIVDAAGYQFDGGPARVATNLNVPTLSVQAGSSLLVDVPRSIAAHQWLVAAYSVDGDGKLTAIPDASSPIISDKHTTRVSTTPLGVTTYVLRITTYGSGADVAGVWSVQIRTTG